MPGPLSMLRSLAAPFACVVLATAPSAAPNAASARALTLDDRLGAQAFGQIALAPGGRWLVVQTMAPYLSAPRFDFDGYAEPTLSRLTRIDLRRPGPGRRLDAGAPGAGVTPGPFSPSGRAMVVWRYWDHRWETGVADLASGRIAWLGVGAEEPAFGRSIAWRSERELVMIALPRGEAPLHMRSGWQAKARLTQLWRVSAQGRRPALSLVGAGRFAGLDPPAPTRRLISFNLRTGAVKPLASGGFFDIELSADRRYLAAIGEGATRPPAPAEPMRMGAAQRARNLTLIDLATGRVSSPLGSLDLVTHLLSWSPTDERLLVYGRIPTEAGPQGRLISLDARTGLATPLTPSGFEPQLGYTSGGFAVVRADWLDGAPVVFGRPAAAPAPGVPGAAAGAADRGPRRDGPRGDWFWLDALQPRNLTAGLAHVPELLSAVTDKGLVLVADGAVWRVGPDAWPQRLTLDGGLHPLASAGFGQGERFAVNPAVRGGVLLASGPGRLAALSRSGDVELFSLAVGAVPIARADQGLIVRRTDEDVVLHLELAAPGARPRPLITLNRALAGVERARLRQVDHLGPSGERLKSWLLLPTHLPAGRRAALIVLPYPGAVFADPPLRGSAPSPGDAPDPELLAARGYAVLLPSLPRDRSTGEPAEGLAEEIDKVVDASLAMGDIDPDRIALWGHSFGGYAALVVAAHSHRYKAIIAASAPSDLAAIWGAAPPQNRIITEDGYPTSAMMGWVETGQAGLGGPPWSDPERYQRNSPLFDADAITTPLFLIYGEQDFVPAAEGEAMFAALWRQDKDAVLMRLWGEGHTPSSPANIRALYGAVFGWLDKVMGAPGS
jgi:dipeptidyl aminopeptidase/acylaminoacyl peptidase